MGKGAGEVGPGPRCGWVRKRPRTMPRARPFLKARTVLSSSGLSTTATTATVLFKVRKVRLRGEGRVVWNIPARADVELRLLSPPRPRPVPGVGEALSF